MTSKKPKLIAKSTRFYHPQMAPGYFAQTKSDTEKSKEKGAEQFPFYQTTYGNAHGYNFRMREQHAAANYVARPIAKHQTCDTELATAPLFRRGNDGIRQMYADEPMDHKKSLLVHPPIRPHVPATDSNPSHDKRKFARTYRPGQTQTVVQAEAHARAQLTFTGKHSHTGSGSGSGSAADAGSIDLSATRKGLKPDGAAAIAAAAATVPVPETAKAYVKPDLLWVSPNSLK